MLVGQDVRVAAEWLIGGSAMMDWKTNRCFIVPRESVSLLIVIQHARGSEEVGGLQFHEMNFQSDD